MTETYAGRLRNTVSGPPLAWFTKLPVVAEKLYPSAATGWQEDRQLTSAARALICGAGTGGIAGPVFVSRKVYKNSDPGVERERYWGAKPIIKVINDFSIKSQNNDRQIQAVEISGINLKLFEENPWLSVAFTYLMLQLSSLHLIDARERVGAGTQSEVGKSHQMGKPTGWITTSKIQAMRQENLGRGLPAYGGWMANEDNVIALGELETWLHRKFTMLQLAGSDMQSFRHSSDLDQLLAISILEIMIRDESFLKIIDQILKNTTNRTWSEIKNYSQ